MKRIYLSILVLMFLPCYSQEKWTLQECMEYAVENSSRTTKQESQYNISAQNYKEAIGKLLPSLNAGTSASINYGRGLDENNTYVDINSFSNGYELSSSLTLFNGFSNIYKVKMQKMNKLANKSKLQETKDMVAHETMEAFFNVLYYKGLVELAEQQLHESAESMRQIRRMEELGMKGLSDVAEMQAKEAQDNYNLTRQKNLLTISIIQLKEKMNFPIDSELDINGRMPEELIVKSDESVFSIYENALSQLPKALTAELSYQAQKLSYRSSKSNMMPSLSLRGGVSTNFFKYMDGTNYASFTDQFRDKRGAYIGLSLSIPIFNGFSSSGQVKRSKQQLIISETEKNETLRTIYSEIEQAVADMNGQVDEYYQAQKQTEAMTVAHNANQRKHKEGLISAIELHTSSNRLLQAKVEELNSQLKYYLKQRLVNYYQGKIIY